MRKIVISFCWCIFIVLLYVGIRNGWTVISYWSDGFCIGGLSLVCIAALLWVGKEGGFDIFSYNVKSHVPGKDSYYDYQQRMKESRKQKDTNHLPIFLVGLFFTALSVVLLLFR